MQAVQDIQAVTECNRHLSGFDLTTGLLRGGLGKLGLNGNAREVLLYLSTCYNESKGVVYPHQATISEALGISIIGVKRAIAELITKGCILKSKRCKNANEYIITKKVLEAVHNDTSKRYHRDTSHDHEVKEHEVKQQHVVVSLKDLKGVEEGTLREASRTAASVPFETHYNINEIPDILKQRAASGKIKNLQRYWGSLKTKARIEWWEEDTAAKLKVQRREELKRQRELREAAEREEARKRQEEASKPITEQMTRAEAVKQVQLLYKAFGRSVLTGARTGEIIRAFEISEEELRAAF